MSCLKPIKKIFTAMILVLEALKLIEKIFLVSKIFPVMNLVLRLLKQHKTFSCHVFNSESFRESSKYFSIPIFSTDVYNYLYLLEKIFQLSIYNTDYSRNTSKKFSTFNGECFCSNYEHFLILSTKGSIFLMA